MTPYRRYNSQKSAADSPRQQKKPKNNLTVFEIQCIAVSIILALIFIIKSANTGLFLKISSVVSSLFESTKPENILNGDDLTEGLGSMLEDTFGSGESAGEEDGSSSEADAGATDANPPGEAPDTETAASAYPGLSFLQQYLDSISGTEYEIKTSKKDSVNVFGDLVPLALVTETDLAKAESFAQKAAGGLLSAPEGCSFEAFFPDVKLSSPAEGSVTSKFGYRYHPITGLFGFHTGTDIANSSGTAIKASAAGKVIERGYSEVWGNYILIEHSQHTQTFYAHCKTLNKSVGDTVKAGEKIAVMGSTGWATGPHLHFEIRIDGVNVNPEWILA